MAVSAHFRDLVLRHALRGQPFSVSWWVSLHTASTANASNEAGGVTRQMVAWTDLFTNTAEITFAMIISPISVSSVGFWDGPSSGNFLVGGTLPATLNLTGGQRPVIPLEGITMTMPTV